MGGFGEVVWDSFQSSFLPERPYLDLAHIRLVLFECLVTYGPLDITFDLNFFYLI